MRDAAEMEEFKALDPWNRPNIVVSKITAIVEHHRRVGTLGEAVHVDPLKPTLKAPGPERLKLERGELLSNFAFKFKLRRYTWVSAPRWTCFVTARQGLTLLPISAQLELTLPLSAQIELTLCPI
jgi:hypothetical protein